MKINILSLGSLKTNCYLVWDKETKEVIIIDAADDGDFIIQKILDLKLRPKLIVATHGHFDHLLGATELQLAFKIPFLIHRADLPLLRRSRQSVKKFLGFVADPPPKDKELIEEGDQLSFGKEKLTVIETPGHTPGGICLYAPGVLFSGDTLFANGIIGRTDFSYASKEKIMRSIKEKLLKLPGNTVVYPGHGRQTTIGAEKRALQNLLKY